MAEELQTRPPREIVKLPLYGQLKEHVSFSELRLFNECGWKWFLRKVTGNEPEDRSFQMDFGKAVHSGMEKLYDKGSELLGNTEACSKWAADMYDQSLSTLTIEHESDRKEAERIKQFIPRFYADCLACPELQGITTLKSELQLFEPISRTDGLSLSFKGFIDITFVKRLKRKTVIYIADFKTCQWGWPASKLQDIEVISQLLLYKHFFCKKMGTNPRDVSIAFILLKKKPKDGEITVEVKKVPAGPKAQLQALEYLQTTVTAMHSYAYERKREACKRLWTDPDTKQERSAVCPFFGTESCPEPPLPPQPAAV